MSEIENAIQILRDSNAKLKQCMGETPSEVYAIDGYETLEKCQAEYDAVKLAIQALQEKLDRENPQPLSLEQLRQMCGEPIYKVDFVNPEYTKWVILEEYNIKYDLAIIDDDTDYGESWLAYDRPPKEQAPCTT